MAGRLIPALPILVALFSTRSPGHDIITTPITFSREISRLFYNRCVECHRPGGSAFSLATYEEARPWAKAIEEEVLERRMPPWGAVKGFGDFRDDRALTQEQLELIAEWVEGGAPGGDPQYLPKLPDFSTPPAAAPDPGGMAVDSALTLEKAVTVAGVRARNLSDGASFMAVAKRPDGVIQPLLWIYNYRKTFDHAYWYRAPLRLPPGTIIEVTPAAAGGLTLLTHPRR